MFFYKIVSGFKKITTLRLYKNQKGNHFHKTH